MSANGVLGSLCFPSFPQFCGQLFARTEDKDVALAMVRAYNDWHIDEWCGSHPGRFIPCALPAIWDPEVMAAEIRRVAKKGCHALTFSENPSKLGWPSIHSDHWDPVWQACSDEGGGGVHAHRLVVAAHHHLARCADGRDDHAAADEHRAGRSRPGVVDRRCASTRTSRSRCPRAASVGSRTSSSAIDYNYDRHHAWTGQDFGDKLPSEVFNEHVLTCFIDDKFGMLSKGSLDMDMVTWECDYPHSDSNWPESPEIFAESAAGAHRRGDRQGHSPQRDAPLPLRPVRRCSAVARTAPWARCASRSKAATWQIRSQTRDGRTQR